MGISMRVVGFTPPDERWIKMKNIYDACREANVLIPDEVAKFFDYSPPDESGIEVNLRTIAIEYDDGDTVGYEVDLARVPKDVKSIRFYVSF
jgi:hypothetical protein